MQKSLLIVTAVCLLAQAYRLRVLLPGISHYSLFFSESFVFILVSFPFGERVSLSEDEERTAFRREARGRWGGGGRFFRARLELRQADCGEVRIVAFLLSERNEVPVARFHPFLPFYPAAPHLTALLLCIALFTCFVGHFSLEYFAVWYDDIYVRVRCVWFVVGVPANRLYVCIHVVVCACLFRSRDVISRLYIRCIFRVLYVFDFFLAFF